MSPICILHLSDLHFDPNHEWDSDGVLNAVPQAVSQLAEKKLVPDIVAITGDIASTGHPDEYAAARKWLRSKLLPSLGEFDEKNLMFVPGNHDVSRGVKREAFEALRNRILTDGGEQFTKRVLADPAERESILARHSNYLDFVNEFATSPAAKSVPWWSVTREFGGQRIRILGLCSSLLSASSDDKGRLVIGKWQVHELLKDSQSADISVALVHHPWSYLADFDSQETISLIVAECHLVLRGHLHNATAFAIQTPNQGWIEIATGACYAGYKYPNTFSLLQVDLAAEHVSIHARRWRPNHVDR